MTAFLAGRCHASPQLLIYPIVAIFFLQSWQHFDDISNARAMPEWMRNYRIFMNREV
jgi:hypothetical protein